MVAPGTILEGRYEIVRPIGRGGMGSVFEAVQRDLGRRVAVKVLDDAEDGLRLAQEARALAALNHPNVVMILDSRVASTPPYLVMDLVEGRSLDDVIRERGRVEPRRAAVIAAQLLSALGAAHRAGIIHRDVKPSNVLVVSAGPMNDLVKVVDFGIAKLTLDAMKQTTRGVVLGSLAYMAPEQLSGQPIDARVDVFATGVTLYQMLSGNPPFDGTHGGEVALAICHSEPAPLVAPPPLVAIVQRAMAKDPNARFASADEMRSALEAFLASTPTSVPSPGTSDFASTVGPSSPPMRAAPPAYTPVTAPPPYAPMPMPLPMPLPMAVTPKKKGSELLLVIGVCAAAVLFLGAGAAVAVVKQRQAAAPKPPPGTQTQSIAIDVLPESQATTEENDAIRRNLGGFDRCFAKTKLGRGTFAEISHGGAILLSNPARTTIPFDFTDCLKDVDRAIVGVRPGIRYRVRL